MSRKPFTEEQRQQRREDILDAAMTVFEDTDPADGINGLEAVSFRKVSAVLGCSYTALYRYFSSKEILVNALRARAFAWIRDEMLRAIDPTAPFDIKLNALSQAYIQSAVNRPQRYAMMFFDLDETDTAKQSLELKTAKRSACENVTSGHKNSLCNY